MEKEIIFKEESYRITGACIEVYREKGCGLLEAVYQECVEIELALQGIPFVPQKPLALDYKTRPLQARYEPDFICFEKIILELKAVKDLTDEHRAQVQNYLKATEFKLGLLVNFGHYPKLQVERIVNTHGRYDHHKRDEEKQMVLNREIRERREGKPGRRQGHFRLISQPYGVRLPEFGDS